MVKHKQQSRENPRLYTAPISIVNSLWVYLEADTDCWLAPGLV